MYVICLRCYIVFCIYRRNWLMVKYDVQISDDAMLRNTIYIIFHTGEYGIFCRTAFEVIMSPWMVVFVLSCACDIREERHNEQRYFKWSTLMSGTAEIYLIDVKHSYIYPDSKVHGADMGPTWLLSDPDGSNVGPMNLAIRVLSD